MAQDDFGREHEPPPRRARSEGLNYDAILHPFHKPWHVQLESQFQTPPR
jgi:hypothetical protein